MNFEIFTTSGPRVCNHAGALVKNRWFIYGGSTDNTTAGIPINYFYYLDMRTKIWNKIPKSETNDKNDENSIEKWPPSLSHHACVSLSNRYFVIVGGWNGKKRVYDIYVYDSLENRWLPKPKISGFSNDAGLSSHTVSVVKDSLDFTGFQLLVIGREGSLRTQRRHGNSFIINIDASFKTCQYINLSNSTLSRSGHSAIITANYTYILGGRHDISLEVHGNEWIGEKFPSTQKNVIINMKNVTEQQNSYENSLLKKSLSLNHEKPPCGRRRFISFMTNIGIILHGGDSMDGKSRTPLDELWLLTNSKMYCKFFNTKTTNPSKNGKKLSKSQLYFKWINLGNVGLYRSGHIYCVYNNSLYTHGGLDHKCRVMSDVYVLIN